MRVFALLAAVVVVGAACVASANAQTSQSNRKYQQAERTAAGTIIQPTRTIIHHADGTTTVITVPRRSYLNPGTEVSIGYGHRMDYAFPPGGDPGRPYWFYGPDLGGVGGTTLAQPNLIPTYNPHNPF